MDFKDFPLTYQLTNKCIRYLKDEPSVLEGFCEYESTKCFFKAGYDHDTIQNVQHEYDILSKLQQYEFVPKILELKQINQYLIMFIEPLKGNALNNYDTNSTTFINGAKKSLDLLYQLYIEQGFYHRDMHPCNVFIHDDQVYLANMYYSYLPSVNDTLNPFKHYDTWMQDLFVYSLNFNAKSNEDWQKHEDFCDKLEYLRDNESFKNLNNTIMKITYSAFIEQFKNVII